jgi:hypothetical protein
MQAAEVAAGSKHLTRHASNLQEEYRSVEGIKEA